MVKYPFMLFINKISRFFPDIYFCWFTLKKRTTIRRLMVTSKTLKSFFTEYLKFKDVKLNPHESTFITSVLWYEKILSRLL